ncbi:MAG: hydroxymethylbilane synthase [Tepidisphaeraceae bacterium]
MVSSPVSARLRLGTRGSLLALSQSRLIAVELQRLQAGLDVELVTIKTTGDRITDRPLYDAGGKGLFTKELELALLRGEIDFAVHSMKDVPVTMPLVDQTDLVIAAIPKREDPRDVAVMRDPSRGALPRGAVVGTSSLRRKCQILEVCPDARIESLRGNIDTRIQKLRAGEFDVIVLAMAGLKRTGLYDPAFMAPADMLPAPGQGALALQCRRADERTINVLACVDDPITRRCVELERAVVLALHGDCHSPIAALAAVQKDGKRISLRVAVGGRDGTPPIYRSTATSPGSTESDSAVVMQAVQDLINQGYSGRARPQE